MIDNSTYIPGASNDFFSDEAYKERMNLIKRRILT